MEWKIKNKGSFEMHEDTNPKGIETFKELQGYEAGYRRYCWMRF